ncbi:MAG TPA: hypothetical protein VJY35_16140 [Candidatus Eisenbacteria bacterium]|nr:hypothetical protein [Candidatus Eisenbacteria bacterium]
MKKRIGVAGLVALLTFATASAALAQCGGQLLLKFDADVFAYESNATLSVIEGGNGAWKSNAGSALTVVGIMTLFCGPLGDLTPDITPPYTNEYTFVWTGMSAVAATTEVPFGPSGKKWDTDYSAGSFLVYEELGSSNAPRAGAMPAAPPNGTVPVNFQDGGALILSGSLTGLHTIVTRTTNASTAIWGGSFTASWQASGGTRFGAGPTNIGGNVNVAQGNWCGKYPTGCTPSGYTAHPNGKFDYDQTTVARSSTWGAIKQLFR